jgi:cytochrome c551
MKMNYKFNQNTRWGNNNMVKHAGSLFLALLIITFVLSACGGDKTTISTTSPEPSQSVTPASATPTEAATPTPLASSEPAATPEATAAAITATPKATLTPTASPKAAATATPAAATPKPTAKPTATPKAEVSGATAKALFKQSCTSCHGVDLGGDFGPNLQKVGEQLTKAQIITQITDGGTSMPPFGKRLKAEEIQTLADWLAAMK